MNLCSKINSVVSMIEWKKLGAQLYKQIRPATYPIAITFLKKIEDASKKIRRPRVRVTGCNLFSLARRHGLSLLAAADDIACSAIAIFGFIEFSDGFVNWYSDFLGNLYTQTREIAKKSIMNLPRIEYGKFSAIMVSPLEKTEVKPDLIMVYMDPAQVHQFLLGLYKKNGNGMSLEFTTGEPVSTCSYGIAKAYNTKETQLILPGTGDRSHGLTQDDELAVAIPIEELPNVVNGIEESMKALGRRYPVPMDLELPLEIDEYQKALLRFLKERA